MTTEIQWTPVYDGHGMMTNSDPNTYETNKSCDVCGMVWVERNTDGQVEFDTKTPARSPR